MKSARVSEHRAVALIRSRGSITAVRNNSRNEGHTSLGKNGAVIRRVRNRSADLYG